MTGIDALLWFTVWTLALMFLYVGRRVLLVLTFKKAANSWGRGEKTDDPPLFVRAQHAHLNALENLPVFAAIVLAGVALGKSGVVDQVAMFVLAARVAQSIVHLIGTTPALVFVRANFLIIQALLFLYMVWGLLA